MDNETRQAFTRRLSQCNRGQLIAVMYDIYFAFEEDVRQSAESDDFSGYKDGIHRMQNVLMELISSLDHKYPISGRLHSLYQYCSNELSRALYEYRLDGVDAARRVMEPLGDAFHQVAAQDQSAPLMDNVQQVYAGMTYGRNDLTENCVEDRNRGFFV